MWNRIKVAAGAILGGWFIYIGIQHFTDPIWFEPIVPDILGWPRFWVWVSGVAEIMVGLLLIIPRTRRIGGLACATLLVILYWANLNMWINNIAIGGRTYEHQWHVLRLLIQTALIGLSVFIWGGIGSDNHQQD
ncbi:MAG TPA: DoxX family membrane protein [Candidatus Thalassarchaeaceae archaeon]|nr:MAG TPA: DoxX family membrane protein [Candidatus Poseidoniales archaeon]HIH85271.1 DoxX family membrane protein [Candidatus Thalassarchaeaceae archaeon]|tara:strand:+ start:26 stop:427 length:402 start_codon:yes stop_codon:yes gene_type:complete